MFWNYYWDFGRCVEWCIDFIRRYGKSCGFMEKVINKISVCVVRNGCCWRFVWMFLLRKMLNDENGISWRWGFVCVIGKVG